MRTRKLIAFAVLSAGFVSGVARASVIEVDFSFGNTIGNVPGTVTGILDFAAAGTNIAATAVYITSAPGAEHPPSASTNVLDGPLTNTVNSSNSFSVSSAGVVTAADFYIVYDDFLLLELNAGGVNEFNNTVGEFATGNQGGFDGASYVAVEAVQPPPTSQTPEPWTMALLGAGLLGMTASRIGRRTSVASPTAVS